VIPLGSFCWLTAFRQVCQLPCTMPRLNQNEARVIEHDGHRFALCSEGCEWIFKNWPQAYASRKQFWGALSWLGFSRCYPRSGLCATGRKDVDHGRNVLTIADEAPGIDSGVWDAVGGTMAGGNVHIVMAGNPTKPSEAFFDAFTNERSLWNCITVTAFDSPNLMGLSLEQLLLLDSAEGGPLDQNLYPYLVTRRWVYEHYHAWWHGSESSSPDRLARYNVKPQELNALAQVSLMGKVTGTEALLFVLDAIRKAGNTDE
jgi:hypothetical protein